MITSKFKDRFEEFALRSMLDLNENYVPCMSEDNWLNALSEIDKEVEKEIEFRGKEWHIAHKQMTIELLAAKRERQELVNALTHIIQISTDPAVSSETYFEILKSYKFLISKYSKD